jgi:hypothetical protein
MISMNRMSAMLVSLKQTVFAIMFLMSETTTESELGTRGKILSVCLMFVDFLQVGLSARTVHAHCPHHLMALKTLIAFQVLRATVSVSLGWSAESASGISAVRGLLRTLNPCPHMWI